MRDLLVEITDPLNLRWAWEKVKREAVFGDNRFDHVQVAAFDLQLDRNLRDLASKFGKEQYDMASVRPVPFPKHQDEEGNQRVRQSFQVSIRDQVAWTAVVNLLGPHIDSKMPPWSYGNRLYRTIWIEENSEIRIRRLGPYRHASGHLYLRFGQSWPIFRRHVYLATRAMNAFDNRIDRNLDRPTEEELEFQLKLKKEHRCQFVDRSYWQSRRPTGENSPLYWCSIDFEKFYPTINLNVVKENIVNHLPSNWKEPASKLLDSMLVFPLDLTEWSGEELSKMDLTQGQRIFEHIPTGLHVSGFLANVSLLEVDLKVGELLETRNIAHFRFVDDHIILAYDFEEMTQWVLDYRRLLEASGNGAHMNLKKTEPKQLASFLDLTLPPQDSNDFELKRKIAVKSCQLDPEFPSPLMTKTLALISGIAHMDFNLLELQELSALTDQLEHLLLVQIPDEEIPEKTRLSFAATRLVRIAECRLANPEPLPTLFYQRDNLLRRISKPKEGDEENTRFKQELSALLTTIRAETEKLDKEVSRAFQLLRKVLRDQPDRVRLWTRAVAMCRQTGIKGLSELCGDIRKQQKMNPLAADYLLANFFVLLADQLILAIRLYSNPATVEWRRVAARSFLQDVSALDLSSLGNTGGRWFLHSSWLQFCFGSYCADKFIANVNIAGDEKVEIHFPAKTVGIGKKILEDGGNLNGQDSVDWLWWATQRTLRDLEPHANNFALSLASEVSTSEKMFAFWRFFPLDIPSTVLKIMWNNDDLHSNTNPKAGWWFDALRQNPNRSEIPLEKSRRKPFIQIEKLFKEHKKHISMYEWCKYVKQISMKGGIDPRCGEWTALEITRQIANLLSERPQLGVRYLRRAKKGISSVPYVHPANFLIPRVWLESDDITWEAWRTLVNSPGHKIVYVPQSHRIEDERYTPLSAASSIYTEVNRVRGVGLILYGLLKNTFDLPALWNGSGHSDVLQFLPWLLLQEITCSSWTLGILEGCLQSRAMENLFLNALPLITDFSDTDTAEDPLRFKNEKEVSASLLVCQNVLVNYQLSTLNHEARQLTPVSIKQLTQPEWSRDFGDVATGDRAHHD